MTLFVILLVNSPCSTPLLVRESTLSISSPRWRAHQLWTTLALTQKENPVEQPPAHKSVRHSTWSSPSRPPHGSSGSWTATPLDPLTFSAEETSFHTKNIAFEQYRQITAIVEEERRTKISLSFSNDSREWLSTLRVPVAMRTYVRTYAHACACVHGAAITVSRKPAPPFCVRRGWLARLFVSRTTVPVICP